MKFLKTGLLLTSMLLIFSCSEINNEILADCEFLEDATPLRKGNTPDWFTSVYLYNDEYYFVGNCKICDYIAIPHNCSGIPICEVEIEEWFSQNGGPNCIKEFYQAAEFQFNVVMN